MWCALYRTAHAQYLKWPVQKLMRAGVRNKITTWDAAWGKVNVMTSGYNRGFLALVNHITAECYNTNIHALAPLRPQ